MSRDYIPVNVPVSVTLTQHEWAALVGALQFLERHGVKALTPLLADFEKQILEELEKV